MQQFITISFLALLLSCINVVASYQQNPKIIGSFDPQRQRSKSEEPVSYMISRELDRLKALPNFTRCRSVSDTAILPRKMVIESVTNDTPYKLDLIDKRNRTTLHKTFVQSMSPQSICECNYEIKNSRDTPIEYHLYETNKKEQLMNDAQFKIELFDNKDRKLKGKSNYVNVAIVDDVIKIRHTHHYFNDNGLRLSIIDLTRYRNCNCDPNRIEVLGCGDCRESLETIKKSKLVSIAVTLKMSEENKALRSGIIDFNYTCTMQSAFRPLHYSL